MKNKLNQVRMDYLYRNEWKTKDTTMSELCQQVKEGKYLRLVKGVRGEEAVITRAGLGIQNVAASDLPKVWPAWETSGGYTWPRAALISYRRRRTTVALAAAACERDAADRMGDDWQQRHVAETDDALFTARRNAPHGRTCAETLSAVCLPARLRLHAGRHRREGRGRRALRDRMVSHQRRP